MDNQIVCFCELIKNALHLNAGFPLSQKIDWTDMVHLAKEHNLLPIFMETAVKYPSYIERPECEKEMQEALSVVAIQIKRTEAFLRLYKAFTDANIYPIIMKGLICRELYGVLRDHRPSSDEDILIRPHEYKRAREILITNGYVPQNEPKSEKQLQQVQEVSYIHPEQKLHIELHLNPMGRENDVRSRMSDYFQNVFERYREVEVSGVLVRTMSHQDHFVFLILHAFRHFIGGGFGIRQVIDILLYQQQFGSEIDMDKLPEVLQGFKADTFWSDLVHIGNLYLGFRLPVIQKPNCPQELLEDMIHCGVFGNGTQAGVTAARATMFATGECLKNRSSNSIMKVWKTIFPSKAYLLYGNPYLEQKPWLVPYAWIRRWGRFIKRSRKNKGNLAIESLKIRQRRLKLLKKYDLV